MTLPRERSRAVKYTREFLIDLLYPHKTPKVPKAIRDRARKCLKHYPWDFDMFRASESLPDVFGLLPRDE